MAKGPQLAKISTIIAKYSIIAKKKLSQNFILDEQLTDKIVGAMGEINTYDILEIGPGPGALTRSLLKLGARRVIAIEKDAQFIKPLEEISKVYPGKLEVLNNDILSFEAQQFLNPPVKIVSNLPYNIGTQILINLITTNSWPPFWESLTFMFQKEVAERIVSKPNTKSYGRLSIMSQWRSTVELLFEVNANAFLPAPKINSAVVQFTPMDKPLFPADKKVLESLVKKSFGQRRKMIRQSLKRSHEDIKDILFKAEIDSTARPEELSIKQFCNLAKIVNQKRIIIKK